MLLRLCEEASPLPGRTWLLPRWSRLGLGYHPIGVMTVQLRPGDSDTMDEEPGLTESERAELERLRAENAALRAQGQAVGPRPPRPGGRQRWRTIVASLLIVLGCVLAPLAGVAA